jgi:hypothetical protein
VKNAVFSQKQIGCPLIDCSENIIQYFVGLILILGFWKSKQGCFKHQLSADAMQLDFNSSVIKV